MIPLAFVLGWLGHFAYSYDPQNGLQWQFASAALRGNLAEVQRWYSRGALIDATPNDESRHVFDLPALEQAAGAGRTRTVEWLLDHGANPNLKVWAATPLEAAEKCLTEVHQTIDVLKEHGARSRYPEPEPPNP